MKSPLIILTGLPATGKSTIAAALAQSLGWPLLSKDAFKEPLMAALPGYAAGQSRALSDASFEALFALLPAVLERATGVILEGNFRGGEHEAALAPVCDARPVLQLLCRVPETVRSARVVARAAAATRSAGHPLADQMRHSDTADRFLEVPSTRIQLDGAASLDENWIRIRSAAESAGFCV